MLSLMLKSQQRKQHIHFFPPLQPMLKNKRAVFIHRLDIQNYLLYLSNNDKSKKSSQMTESFGRYIRKLRNEKELTLTQLGAKLGLDSANLSKIENGKREFDEKRLTKLASVFSLDLEVLKTEFFSDLFAKKLYDSNCSTQALSVAEEKVNYLIQNNVKQGKLKFNKKND